MAQQPFTPQGVTLKQAELDQLPPLQLLQQANLIRSDLRNWVTNNFLLDPGQQGYLSQIDDRWIALASALVGFAVENVLPVVLNIQGSGTLKLIELTNNINTSYSINGFTASGSVYITEIYS